MKRKLACVASLLCMAITLSAFGQSNINVEQNETSDSVAQTYFQRRNPKTALVLSMLVLPGTGQMYNGDYVSGMLYAAGCISSQVLFIQGLYYINTNNKVQFLFSICGTVIGGLGMMLCWAGSWITAYQQAQTMNQEHGLLSWKVATSSNKWILLMDTYSGKRISITGKKLCIAIH